MHRLWVWRSYFACAKYQKMTLGDSGFRIWCQVTACFFVSTCTICNRTSLVRLKHRQILKRYASQFTNLDNRCQRQLFIAYDSRSSLLLDNVLIYSACCACAGAISGLPCLANRSLNASATRLCSVVSFCTARILSWSRTCFGKWTVIGLVPALPPCLCLLLARRWLVARMTVFLWRALPPVSASNVQVALLLMCSFLFVFLRWTRTLKIYL